MVISAVQVGWYAVSIVGDEINPLRVTLPLNTGRAVFRIVIASRRHDASTIAIRRSLFRYVYSFKWIKSVGGHRAAAGDIALRHCRKIVTAKLGRRLRKMVLAVVPRVFV